MRARALSLAVLLLSYGAVGARQPAVRASVPLPAPASQIAEALDLRSIDSGLFAVKSVRTLFSMEDRRARICRRVRDNVCIRLRTQGDLPWTGGEGEWLDYPADGLHAGDERDDTIDALGSTDPDRTAREYFLVTRRHQPVPAP